MNTVPATATVLADDVVHGPSLVGVGELVHWRSWRLALATGGGVLLIALTVLAARRFAEPRGRSSTVTLASSPQPASCSCLPAGSRSTPGGRSSQLTSDREHRAGRGFRGCLGGIGCPSIPTRRRGSGCHRQTVPGLSSERSCPLPIARHARPGGHRRSGAPRLGVRGFAGTLGGHAHQPGGCRGCGDRGRGPRRSAADACRNQEGC